MDIDNMLKSITRLEQALFGATGAAAAPVANSIATATANAGMAAPGAVLANLHDRVTQLEAGLSTIENIANTVASIADRVTALETAAKPAS